MTLTGISGNSTVDTTGGTISLAGNLTGTGGLAKIGPGTLTLTGSNTYSGSTTVDGGTLQMPSGSLASPTQYIGYSASGSFLQSGGSNGVSYALVLGNSVGSSGTYSLSGGAAFRGVRDHRLCRRRQLRTVGWNQFAVQLYVPGQQLRRDWNV